MIWLGQGMSEETMTQSIEHRKHARLDMALAVSYAIQRSSDGASEMAETMSSDISASGIRLMTPSALENGSLLHLEIRLSGDDAEPIRAQGEVVWQNRLSDHSYETGTVIRHMEEQDKMRFMGFVFDQLSRLVGTTNTTLN
jgi:c-di-GMP-binding flagellar brake protein YcgR